MRKASKRTEGKGKAIAEYETSVNSVTKGDKIE